MRSRHGRGQPGVILQPTALVKSRVFWGLSIDEIAKSLGVGRATVDRDWSFAKAWLKKEMAEGRH